MSLLIKALDQAAKSKALDEQQQLKNTPKPEALALELSPVIKNNSQRYAQSLADEAGISMSSLQGHPVPSTPQSLGNSAQALGHADLKDHAEQEAHGHVGDTDDNRQAVPAQDTTSQSPSRPPLKPGLAASAKDTQSQHTAHQKVAASVFMANDAPSRQSTWLALILISIAGALTVWLLWQGVLAMKSWLAVDAVTVTPSPMNQVTPMTELDAGDSNPSMAAQVTDSEVSLTVSEMPARDETDLTPMSPQAQSSDPQNRASDPSNQVQKTAAPIALAFTNSDDRIKDRVLSRDDVRTPATNTNTVNAANKPLTLIRKTPLDAVDPAVLAAYDAFQRGDYEVSQQQYRQALQQDVRNIDALLGMAAIAQQQNRMADAAGWYQKVLEIAPRNPLALAALMRLQANQDDTANEARLKNLITQQPNVADLHAALGHFYASKQQWVAAQEAYFNASRLSPYAAEHAFNVAVSLEHLNKPQLALAEYKRTLSLINNLDAIGPSRDVVEARIQALQ